MAASVQFSEEDIARTLKKLGHSAVSDDRLTSLTLAVRQLSLGGNAGRGAANGTVANGVMAPWTVQTPLGDRGDDDGAIAFAPRTQLSRDVGRQMERPSAGGRLSVSSSDSYESSGSAMTNVCSAAPGEEGDSPIRYPAVEQRQETAVPSAIGAAPYSSADNHGFATRSAHPGHRPGLGDTFTTDAWRTAGETRGIPTAALLQDSRARVTCSPPQPHGTGHGTRTTAEAESARPTTAGSSPRRDRTTTTAHHTHAPVKAAPRRADLQRRRNAPSSGGRAQPSARSESVARRVLKPHDGGPHSTTSCKDAGSRTQIASKSSPGNRRLQHLDDLELQASRLEAAVRPMKQPASGRLPSSKRPAQDTAVPAMKRFVLRHVEGESRVQDESFASCSELDDSRVLQDHSTGSSRKVRTGQENVEIGDWQRHGDVAASRYHGDGADGDSVVSRGEVDSDGDDRGGDRRHRVHAGQQRRREPTSFIRPSSSRTTAPRSSRKTDPVQRYHDFNRTWSSLKLPGEAQHKRLRWNVRANMAQKYEVEYAHRQPLDDTYMIPPGKKRSHLHWDMRTSLRDNQ